jgi:D-alanyl-D-alanine carboxypeptidase
MEHPSCDVILAHHCKQSLEIASLTKIMTFYVVCRIADDKNVNIKLEKTEVHP